MIPDLNWWGRLLGLLAVEAALIVAVAALLTRLARRPQLRRVMWQGCLVALALVWLGELAGLRGQLARLMPVKPAERTLAVRLVEVPVGEPMAELLPAETLSLPPAADVQPAANVLPQPVWWPGWLWLAGLTALAGRLLLTRAGLAWCVFKTRCGRLGPSFREHEDNCGARPRVSVLECVRLAAAFVLRPRLRDAAAGSGKAEAPLRCASALQDAGAHSPAPRASAVPVPAGIEASVMRLRASLRLGPVRVQVWPQLRGPVAFGIFRPTVALPADFATRFTPPQREAMLAHELAHLAARDPLWLALADIVCALAWWHPAVWWARRQLRAAGEAAADEASALVPDGRAALAESLVAFGRELTSPGPARGLGVSGSGLKSELARRVTTLLGPHREWRRLHPLWRWGGHGLAVLTAVMLALLPVSLAGLGTAPLATLAQAVQKTVKQADQESGSEASGKVAQGTATGTESPQENQPGAEKSEVPDAATGMYGFSEAVRVTALARELSHRLKRPVTTNAASLQQALAAYLTTADFGSVPTQDLLSFRSQLEDLAGDYAWLSVYSGGLGKKHTRQAENAFRRVVNQLFEAADSWPSEETVSADRLAEVETERATLPNRIEDARQRLFAAVHRVNAGEPGAREAGGAARMELDSLLRRHTMLSKESEFLRKHYQAPGSEAPKSVPVYRRAAPDPAGARSPITAPPFGPGTNETLVTRQYHLDAAKFLARIMEPKPHEFGDPMDTALGRIQNLPNRSLSDGVPVPTSSGAPWGTLPPATMSLPLTHHEVTGVTRTNPMFNLQPAVREFFQAQGITFPPPEPILNPVTAVGAVPSILPPQNSAAVFFSDRSGVLLVRATLADLERIERAIQDLNLPPASLQADQRAELEQKLLHQEVVLTELHTRYKDRHPLLIEARMQLDDLRAQSRRAQLTASTPAPVDTATIPAPAITLAVHFAEITEGSADDIGLDWLFGQSPTNNPALQSGPATTLLTQTNAPKGQNVRVDLLRSEGQSATLMAAQFAALRARLESRAGVDFLTAPKVTTRSGQQAQVAVSEVRTLVTGVQATNGTATAPAVVNYLTEEVPVGPVVDVVPTAEGAAWRIRIQASLTEFLGYDDPGGAASISAPGTKPVTYQQPLPRLRVRALEATPLANLGETVALRGPLVVDTKITKGRLFRRERTETTRKRLYVFVTPQ